MGSQERPCGNPRQPRSRRRAADPCQEENRTFSAGRNGSAGPLGKAQRFSSEVLRLPVTRRVELDGKIFYLVHATPRDPFDEYLKDDSDGWKARLQGIEADYVIVGHSHTQFCVEVGDTKVINPGSVGQPRDGDPRAAYCVIEDGEVSFRRVEYDVAAAVQNMSENGIEGSVLELAEHFMKTGGRMLPG
jgi:diadenosine tetraphosphatase ApaH/serine/threonine PP2A family protein phosphatase